MIDSFRGEWEFLSNFYPLEFYYWENKTYKSAEHAYQSQKAKYPVDKRLIEGAPTPGVAKKMGRQVMIRDDWEFEKLHIMLKIVRRKFNHRELAEKLLLTGDQELVEGNTWGDDFWGRCSLNGKNNLGKILMLVRDEIPRE